MHGLFFTTAAGLTANFFMSWYGKFELIIMAAFALFWLLCFISRDCRVCGFTILFVTISGAGFTYPFDLIFIQPGLEFDNFIFSNVISTVTQASGANIHEILLRMTGSVLFSIICLLGVLIWAIYHPVMAVAYAPCWFFRFKYIFRKPCCLLFGTFFWFGGAYFAILIMKMFLYHVMSRFRNLTHNVITVFSSAVCVFLFILIWLTGPPYQFTKPSIPAPIVRLCCI